MKWISNSWIPESKEATFVNSCIGVLTGVAKTTLEGDLSIIEQLHDLIYLNGQVEKNSLDNSNNLIRQIP